MPVLITGATGFVGQHLVRYLVRHDFADKIYCLVRKGAALPADILERVSILEIENEYVNPHAEVIQKCEIIFHLAGNAVYGDKGDYQESNVDLTGALISIAQKSEALRRFVFTSSVAAIDRTPADNCSLPLNEESKPFPSSQYGRSKLICEQSLHKSGLPFVIVRPGWVYGPGMRIKSHVRFFIESVEQGRLFTQFNFSGRVSLIHVEDLVRSLLFVAKHPGSTGQTYFAADDEPVSLGELSRRIGGFIGKKAGWIPMGWGLPELARRCRRLLPFLAQNLFSDVLYVSPSKLQRLGFRTLKDLREGLLETLHWHFLQKEESGDEKTAVVTGGTGGIGRALCEQLFARGYQVISIDKAPPESGAGNVLWRSLQFDLSDANTMEDLCRQLEPEADKIEVWINNAGFGMKGDFADLDLPAQTRMIATNCSAFLVLSHFIVQKFITQKRGVLVNLSSSSAFQPLPSMAVYAATKAFVLRWSEALSREKDIAEAGVKVITVCPAGTKTNFQKCAGVRGETRLLEADKVASEIIASLKGPSRTLLIGVPAYAMYAASKFVPREFQPRLWGFLMDKMR